MTSPSKNNSQVSVFISTDNENKVEVKNLTNLFNDNIFTDIIYVEKKPPSGSLLHIAPYRLLISLKNADVELPNKYILYILDTSVTISTSDYITDAISKAIQLNENGNRWDIVYLNKWNENCDKIREITHVSDGLGVFTSSYSPKGLQAVLISPDGRDRLLGKRSMENGRTFHADYNNIEDKLVKAIEDKNIVSVNIQPNLFEYDIRYATSADDYVKTHECLEKSSYDEHNVSKSISAASSGYSTPKSSRSVRSVVNTSSHAMSPKHSSKNIDNNLWYDHDRTPHNNVNIVTQHKDDGERRLRKYKHEDTNNGSWIVLVAFFIIVILFILWVAQK
ncbi:Hypothetical protein ORPV_979 [Orpheovirus IHUMI-LCC2]|uniref:Uncharacterized protein n=1 Tax=Orpheovirus IHUMI-LCC2 TaxID=2023057 RepID=A0A2I2L5S4_9VIRU|nr:Hypothetical protein ORPV_979 [Orpheovirus IHUMI-LCC2]SNW62883.1 Hypothetical protein ORPV_979 [Orpheovirus IHUMI-LCC2]